MKKVIMSLVIIITFLPLNIFAADSIESKTKTMKKYTGYFNYYWDDATGNIYLKISNFKNEFLLVNSISQGLGSNDIGFDRGRLAGEHVVYFERVGPKVLLVQKNYNFRAVSKNQNEKRAIEESFARSTLWGFKVEAESNNEALVDLTPFLLSDNQFLLNNLSEIEQGTFLLDQSRSAINLERTKNFPENSEFDMSVTFTGKDPGNFIRDVSPTAQSFTIYQHLSFIKLPDDNYKMRINDPRSGYFGISYQDYATPISETLTKQFIVRHRLQKQYPEREKSPVKKPIIYYLDNGTPEPIRSALLEGALWWKQAFEAAGLENAYDVKILPDDADPMDVRYNVIQWVHRATRGWSYGNVITDPRSGEILKGHVSLGSLRVRQDFLLAEGLLAPYSDDSVSIKMQEMALARLRQLSAHEVGHTLGLQHNFAASYNNRASVMDYPHPLIKIKDNNTLDLSEAYDTDIGEWDKIAIMYGYCEFVDEHEEEQGLKKIIADYIAKGIKYISDSDARPAGGAHPYGHLWENGKNPAAELEHMLNVRAIVLNHFSENVIKTGEPYAELEKTLVPIYLLHRYSIDAASKLVGGLEYTYAVRGDGQLITDFIDGDLQKKAFNALLKTLSPSVLKLNEQLLQILPPQPPGYPRTRESFSSRTNLTFDPLSAAEAAIDISLIQIFNPERLARIIQYQQRDNKNPSINELFDIYFEKIIAVDLKDGLDGEIQRLVQDRSVEQLIQLDQNAQSASYVKTWAQYFLKKCRSWYGKKMSKLVSGSLEENHFNYQIEKINSYFRNPKEYIAENQITIPPGSPIGNDYSRNCDF